MKNRRVLSVFLMILGIAFFLGGNYISNEVLKGEKKISHAQRGVDQGKGLTGLSPYTKDLGDMATDSVQKKIDAGREEARDYQMIANWLHGGGAVFFIAGLGLLIYSFVDKRRL